MGLRKSDQNMVDALRDGRIEVNPSKFKTFRLALRLGQRLSTNRSQASALVIVGLVALWISVALAALLATPAVLSAQKAVADRTAVTASDTPTGLAVEQTFLDWKDKFRIRRVVIAGGLNSPPAPGLLRPVRPGEVWISPALRDEIASDPDLAEMTRRHTTGIISPEGLSSPGQMLEYVGATPQEMNEFGVASNASFGGEVEYQTISPVLGPLAIVTVLLMVVVPLGVLLVAALGQLATRRADRYRILDQLGMPGWATRLTLSVDGIVACFAGSVAGLIVFAIAAEHVTSLPGVPATWWPDQVNVTPLLVLIVLILPAGLAACSALLIKGRPSGDALGKGQSQSWVRLLPLLMGLILAATTIGTRVDSSLGAVMAISAAVGLITVGVPLAVPVITARAGRRLLTQSKAPNLMAGGRLVRGQPSARRAGTVLAASVILATAASPLVAQAAPRDPAVAKVNHDLGRVVVLLSGLSPDVDLNSLTALPGVLDVTAIQKVSRKTVITLPCDSFTHLTGRPSSTCKQGRQYRLSQLYPASTGNWAANMGNPVIRIGAANRKLPQGLPPYDSQAIALVDNDASYWRLTTHIRASSTLGSSEAELGGLIGGAQQPYARLQSWLMVGLSGLLFTAAISLLLGLAEDSRARRRTVSGLLVIGVAAPVIRRAHRLELAIRLGATAVLSIAVSAFLAIATTSWSGANSISTGWYGLLALAVLATTLVGILVGPLSVLPRHPLQDLRND